jgi:lysophospholipase L1-like esterase
VLACAAVLAACASTPAGGGTAVPRPPSPSAPATAGSARLAYAALGASETYGVGASPISDGYAYRLRDQLRLAAGDFADVAIPGATLADAYQVELTNALTIQPSVSTVFFGVNDIRAGVPLARFTSDLTDLVTTLRRARSQVLVVGIPDLTVLPALRGLRGADLAGLTRDWNAAMRGAAAATGAAFLDLEALSTEIATHPEEVAPDGLHPSDAGHARLAAVILAALRSQGYVRA